MYNSQTPLDGKERLEVAVFYPRVQAIGKTDK